MTEIDFVGQSESLSTEKRDESARMDNYVDQTI